MNKTLVVLTGAGISAESGLRTFRDSGGLWEGYNVEDVATPRAFARNPELVLRFYNERRKNVLDAKPNKAHKILSALEPYFNVRIVTQNIDNLHERSGSTNVLHLHGEICKMRSVADESRIYPITSDINVGDTDDRGHQLRPHIVWFEEAVPAIEEAAAIMQEADYFLLIGTSLAVYPAAGLLDFVADEVPKYVVDKVIPPVSRFKHIIPVPKPATEGMEEVARRLLAAIGKPGVLLIIPED
jgi:NAD-dependent deacetylase